MNRLLEDDDFYKYTINSDEITKTMIETARSGKIKFILNSSEVATRKGNSIEKMILSRKKIDFEYILIYFFIKKELKKRKLPNNLNMIDFIITEAKNINYHDIDVSKKENFTLQGKPNNTLSPTDTDIDNIKDIVILTLKYLKKDEVWKVSRISYPDAIVEIHDDGRDKPQWLHITPKEYEQGMGFTDYMAEYGIAKRADGSGDGP